MDVGGAPPVSSPGTPETLLLFGVPFHNVSRDETLRWMAGRARSGRPAQILTTNLDFILQAWRDPEMHRIHFEADLVLADGVPPVWFSRFFGPALRERVAGSDLVPLLGKTAREHGLSLYALGAAPGVGEKALGILRDANPGLKVAGWDAPPAGPLLELDHEGLRRKIRDARPDVVFVAFGAPKQEKWIRMNAHELDGAVLMGVGGSLDFIAGTQTRAPRWIRAIGLEWFWRLAGHPRRFIGRYSADFLFLVGFLIRVLFLKMSPRGRSVTAAPAAEPDVETVPLPPLRTAQEADGFVERVRPASRDRFVALDLSGFGRLGSLELGAVARIARECRAAGRRLFLVGACRRVTRWLRMLRIDRYLELPDSADALRRRLEELRAPEETRGSRWTRGEGRLELLLPEEFEGLAARQAGEAFFASGTPREFTVDGRRLRYIDSSGLSFLLSAWRSIGRAPGSTMTLRGFPEEIVEVLRRSGLDAIPRAEASAGGAP